VYLQKALFESYRTDICKQKASKKCDEQKQEIELCKRLLSEVTDDSDRFLSDIDSDFASDDN